MKRSSNSNTGTMHAGSLAPAGALFDSAVTTGPTATARGRLLQPREAGPQQGRLQPAARGLKPAYLRPGVSNDSEMAAQLRLQQRQPQVSRMLYATRMPMLRQQQRRISPVTAGDTQQRQAGMLQHQQQLQRAQQSPQGAARSGQIMFPDGSLEQQG